MFLLALATVALLGALTLILCNLNYGELHWLELYKPR